ncbi:hypothetical protein L596_000579 [Steinernema carpocapsae]|uniref:Uncharacterized protein n=1 Tax=Steinernema carpocapsae TaxID=34508 RepID=A0A4U8UMR7_STECR|nr:hypothetical protein L596_000579 [Steinernema carpocapsae]
MGTETKIAWMFGLLVKEEAQEAAQKLKMLFKMIVKQPKKLHKNTQKERKRSSKNADIILKGTEKVPKKFI